MIRPIAAQAVPRELLLLADPDWAQVQAALVGATCYVVDAGPVISGVVVLKPTTPGCMEVVNLAVSPSYQHQGIAKRLLTFVIEQCRRDPGCAQLQIGTGNSSLRQLALYQRAGFEVQTVWVNYFVDRYPQPIVENGIQCKSMIRLQMPVN